MSVSNCLFSNSNSKIAVYSVLVIAAITLVALGILAHQGVGIFAHLGSPTPAVAWGAAGLVTAALIALGVWDKCKKSQVSEVASSADSAASSISQSTIASHTVIDTEYYTIEELRAEQQVPRYKIADRNKLAEGEDQGKLEGIEADLRGDSPKWCLIDRIERVGTSVSTAVKERITRCVMFLALEKIYDVWAPKRYKLVLIDLDKIEKNENGTAKSNCPTTQPTLLRTQRYIPPVVS